MEIKNKTQSLPPLLPSGTMVTTLPPQQLHHHPSIPIQNIPPNTSEWGGVQHDSPNATTIIPHFNHNVPNHEVFHHQHQHRVMQNQQMNIYDNQRRKHLPNQNFNEEFELQPAPEHHQRPQYEYGPHHHGYESTQADSYPNPFPSKQNEEYENPQRLNHAPYSNQHQHCQDYYQHSHYNQQQQQHHHKQRISIMDSRNIMHAHQRRPLPARAAFRPLRSKKKNKKSTYNSFRDKMNETVSKKSKRKKYKDSTEPTPSLSPKSSPEREILIPGRRKVTRKVSKKLKLKRKKRVIVFCVCLFALFYAFYIRPFLTYTRPKQSDKVFKNEPFVHPEYGTDANGNPIPLEDAKAQAGDTAISQKHQQAIDGLKAPKPETASVIQPQSNRKPYYVNQMVMTQDGPVEIKLVKE